MLAFVSLPFSFCMCVWIPTKIRTPLNTIYTNLSTMCQWLDSLAPTQISLLLVSRECSCHHPLEEIPGFTDSKEKATQWLEILDGAVLPCFLLFCTCLFLEGNHWRHGFVGRPHVCGCEHCVPVARQQMKCLSCILYVLFSSRRSLVGCLFYKSRYERRKGRNGTFIIQDKIYCTPDLPFLCAI